VSALVGSKANKNNFTMQFNPEIHHRRSIRLPGFDYAQPGAYFITICTQGRVCLFGEIVDGTRYLDDTVSMIERWWTELPHKFAFIRVDQHVVMPNHFHGILIIEGAASRGLPEGVVHPSVTLPDIVRWFKTMTTNEYIRGVRQRGWTAFEGKLWQRNYYEHVIRNERDLDRIRQYIRDNPAKWAQDPQNPGNFVP
jgi:REP element-mobilizing transposase RayT